MCRRIICCARLTGFVDLSDIREHLRPCLPIAVRKLVDFGVPRGNAGSDDLRRSRDGPPSSLQVNATSGLVRPDTAPPASGSASAGRSLRPSRDNRQAIANYRSRLSWPLNCAKLYFRPFPNLEAEGGAFD